MFLNLCVTVFVFFFVCKCILIDKTLQLQYLHESFYFQAYSSLEELRSRLKGGNPAYYVNTRTIEAIHRALDIPLSQTINSDKMNGFRSPEDEEGDFIEEDVADDSYSHNV